MLAPLKAMTQKEHICVMAQTVTLRLGLTPTQAVNLLFAQIEQRKAIPFPVAVSNSDVLPSDEHYGDVMKLNDE